MKKYILLIVALLLCLTACGKDTPAPTPTTDSTPAATDPAREVTMIVTEDTISQLENYPQLEKADLTGSTCYAAIRDYMARHPEVAVTYTVSLGKTTVDPSITALRLPDGSYDYETLLESLPHLAQLTSVSLPQTTLSAQQVDALRTALPEGDVSCTVMVGSVELDSKMTELDMSGIRPKRLQNFIARLGYLPALKTIRLTAEDGSCAYSATDVKTLKEAAPGVAIQFAFELFGQTLDASAERVEFVDVQIGNEGISKIRDALDLLTNCTYFKLDNCGIDNETMAQLRDDYPNTEIVWRVHVWERSWLTDTEVLRAVYHVDDTNSGPFKYLTKVKYMDLGHNTEMVDISFCSYMPDLEMAILSGAPIVDLTPLASCKKLEFLEIAWCGLLKDITPLAQCDSLRFLNLGHTSVSDLSPLAGLKLEQLSFVNSGNKVGFTAADWEAIQAQHPDCWITWEPLHDSGATPYSTGWRYKEDHTYTECYRKIRDVFELDKLTGNASVTLTGDAAVKEVTETVTADTIGGLDRYPNLEKADLTGSSCYAEILSYMEDHPRVEVVFTVSLGGTHAKSDTAALTLDPGSYSFEALRQNLRYLPRLRHLTLRGTALTVEQIGILRSENPGLDINTTGKTTLDLSSCKSVKAVRSKLSKQPEATYVELMDGSGKSVLSKADVAQLQQEFPGVTFHYSFSLFGKTVSTTDSRIEYVGTTIGDQGEGQLRQALDILQNCTYFKLDGCGLSNAVMAKLRDDYPGTEIVWRIYVWQRSWLTDTEVLRAVYHVDDSNSYPFRYLTKVKYMDLGHNTEMVDISFCAFMPDLELAILSGAPIKDVSPLANCKKLEFLELAWCGHLTDVSPLAGCDRLRYLNVGHTKVQDFTALKELNLRMLSYVNSGNRVGFTEYHWEQIQAMFPNCWITFNPLHDNDATPYSKGWRYTEAGGYTPIYRKARDVFGYDAMS